MFLSLLCAASALETKRARTRRTLVRGTAKRPLTEYDKPRPNWARARSVC
jgi:hypothetical protein